MCLGRDFGQDCKVYKIGVLEEGMVWEDISYVHSLVYKMVSVKKWFCDT
jgi:hypothetical protein